MASSKKLLFVAMTVTLALIAADIFIMYPLLRLKGFSTHATAGVKNISNNEKPNNLIAHSRYIWAYQPNSHYRQTSDTEDTHIDVQINSLGFRDEEPAARRDANFTFVALGDSFTFGSLVQTSERWDEQLVQMINNQAGIRAASCNIGMWSSTFDQHALMLEDNFPAKTRAVIHLVYPPHVQTIQRHVLDFAGSRIIRCWDPLRNVKDNTLYYGSADDNLVIKELSFPFLWAYLRFIQNKHRFDQYIARSREINLSTDLFALFQPGVEVAFQEGWQKTKTALRQTAAICKGRGVPYIVVIIPMDRQVSLSEWNGAPPIPELLTGSIPQDHIRQILSGIEGVEVLDLLSAMRREDSNALYFKDDPHWRPAGHRFTAEVILDFLKEKGLVNAR